MNAMYFEGRLPTAPVMSTHGETKVTKFVLIRNEYAGKDGQSGERKERTVRIPFVAFGSRGEVLVKNAMKGDQLIVTAHVQNNNYTDGDGGEHYEFNFVLDDFTFGAPGEAKREQLAKRRG